MIQYIYGSCGIYSYIFYLIYVTARVNKLPHLNNLAVLLQRKHEHSILLPGMKLISPEWQLILILNVLVTHLLCSVPKIRILNLDEFFLIKLLCQK